MGERLTGYLTREALIGIRGDRDLRMRCLLDRQQYADPEGDAEAVGLSSASWPLFGLPWPSGMELAATMAARPATAGERILEIGCGLALASLVCHRRGQDITASDCHPLAGDFLLHNAGLNAMSPVPYRHGDWCSGRQPRIPPAALLEGRFDLIIGSDVLYERDEAGQLAGFIGRHAQPAAQVLIVDPDRGNRPAFSRHMVGLGFTLASRALRSLPADALPYKGRLLHYTRSKA